MVSPARGRFKLCEASMEEGRNIRKAQQLHLSSATSSQPSSPLPPHRLTRAGIRRKNLLNVRHISSLRLQKLRVSCLEKRTRSACRRGSKRSKTSAKAKGPYTNNTEHYNEPTKGTLYLRLAKRGYHRNYVRETHTDIKQYTPYVNQPVPSL